MGEQVEGTKPGFKLDHETVIPHNPEMSLISDAFASLSFQQRVEAGAQRVKKYKAESGFSVITNEEEIVYSPLRLGGRHPENFSESAYLGHKASVSTSPTHRLTPSWFEKREWNVGNYTVIGDFHFHPRPGGFSQQDIEYRDHRPTAYIKKINKKAGEFERDSEFKYRPDFFYGIFVPQLSGGSITSVRLIMFAGPPNNTYYQGVDFDEIPLDRQLNLLRESGMNVIDVDLPIAKGRIDLSRLKQVLV